MPDLLYMSCQDCHVQKIWSGFMFRPDFLHVGVRPGRTWILFRLCFLHMGVQPCTRLPAQRSLTWQDMLLLFVQIRLPACTWESSLAGHGLVGSFRSDILHMGVRPGRTWISW